MEGESSFPRSFHDALGAELKAEFDGMEADFSERVSALISQRRSETELEADRLVQEQKKILASLSAQRERTLRAANSAGRKILVNCRLKRLEESLKAYLLAYRESEHYAQYLVRMMKQCAADGFRGNVEVQAERLELDGLGPVFRDARMTEKNLGRWGGFILLEEGGSLLDCTFQTRWEQYRRRLVFSGQGRI